MSESNRYSDNNFAVTTQNLATSMTRAGASANTFGVSMEELLGHTTAIATATRESGSVVGKLLPPNMGTY